MAGRSLAPDRVRRYHPLMTYVLSKIVGALLTPGAILLGLLGLSTALLWTRRWRLGRAVLSLLALAVFALVVLPVPILLNQALEDRFPARPPLPGHVDGIIILGGVIDAFISQARSQAALNDAAERLTEGAALAKAHPEAKVLFTGGSADPLRPEAAEAPWAAAELAALGVERSRILVESRSRNTRENAVDSKALVHPRPGEAWVLVTSARHMPRSVGIFREVGWPVIPWPVDYSTGGIGDWTNADLALNRLRMLGQSLHEWYGLAYYRLRGWTDALFPAP